MRPLSEAEGRIHVVESISIEIDVDVVGNLDAAVPHEAGENFHVNSLVIAVRCEGVAENMLTVELYAGFLAELFGLVGQLLIGVDRKSVLSCSKTHSVSRFVIRIFKMEAALGVKGNTRLLLLLLGES